MQVHGIQVLVDGRKFECSAMIVMDTEHTHPRDMSASGEPDISEVRVFFEGQPYTPDKDMAVKLDSAIETYVEEHKGDLQELANMAAEPDLDDFGD
jgi:hypothetical protein